MASSAQKELPESAAQALEAHFKEDMRGVNALILERLHSDIALIPKIASYLIAAGGKRIRPLLTLAAASFAGDKQIPESYGFAAAVEFIHTATLLHDDVVDGSRQRRGQDSANLIFGNQASVLVGDFLFAKSFELMLEGGSLPALDMLSRAASTIAEGEVLQLSHIGNIEIDEAIYLKIIDCKTAALFRAATKSGAIISGQSAAAQQALYDYGHNLGMCFQIADDIIDYTSSAPKMGKKTGDDFREGKVTLPVLYALQSADDREKAFWHRCLKEKDIREGDFEEALAICQRHNVIARCHETCESYAQAAIKALSALPETSVKEYLRALPYEMINRNA